MNFGKAMIPLGGYKSITRKAIGDYYYIKIVLFL